MIIDKFSGVGSGGMKYSEGFRAANTAGNSILTQAYRVQKVLDSNTDTDLEEISEMIQMDHVNENQRIGWNGSKMYSYDFVMGHDIGLIHELTITGSSSSSDYIYRGGDSKSGMVLTKDYNLLYTSAGHLGYGYKSQAKSGSTTTLVGATGTNFTTITDVTNGSACAIKVYNLDTEEEYTVTSISTTNTTDDTLNFSTASTAVSADDHYILFIDGKWKFDTKAVVANNHFEGQGGAYSWYRRVILWEDAYYIANGNYISKLSLDESTWEKEHVQMPTRFQILDMAYNSNKILITGEVDGKGLLVLWDGNKNGSFLHKIDLPTTTTAITAYGSGFVVAYGSKIYYTDGYSINPFVNIPEVLPSRRNVVWPALNNIKVVFGKILMSASFMGTTNAIAGLVIYDQEDGFSFAPLIGSSGSDYRKYPTGIFTFRDGSQNKIFLSFKDSIGKNVVDIFYMLPPTKSVAIFNIRLSKKQKVSQIKLSLSPVYNRYFSSSSASTNITVNVADIKYPLYQYGYLTGTPTTTSLPNGAGAYTRATIGDEILILDNEAGGDRTYITSIANGGTSSEILTVSPALSSTPTNGNILIMPFKKAATITFIPGTDDNIIFPVSHLANTNNFYIEIIIDGTYYLDINNIEII